MKDEMELLQEMENIDDRNTHAYLDQLDHIIQVKSDTLTSLRSELSLFQKFRGQKV
jgi:hypothetical protein